MATKSEIIACEEVFIEALKLARSGKLCDVNSVRNALRQASEAFTQERNTQGGISSNRDYWGTLGVNARVLGSFVTNTDTALAQECCDLAKMVGIYS